MEEKNNSSIGSEEQVPDFGLDQDAIRECEPSVLLPHAVKLANSQHVVKKKPAEAVSAEEGVADAVQAVLSEAAADCEATPEREAQQFTDRKLDGSESRRYRFPLKIRLAAAACALICLYAGWEIVQESMATAGSHKESVAPQDLLAQPSDMVQQGVSSASVAAPLAMAPMSSASMAVVGAPVAVEQRPVAEPVSEAAKKPTPRKQVTSRPKIKKAVSVVPGEDVDAVLATLQKARETQ